MTGILKKGHNAFKRARRLFWGLFLLVGGVLVLLDGDNLPASIAAMGLGVFLLWRGFSSTPKRDAASAATSGHEPDSPSDAAVSDSGREHPADAAGTAERARRKAKTYQAVAFAAVMLLVGAVLAANAIRAAWDHKLEGDYARREAEGIAQLEAEAAADGGALSDDYIETESDTADNLTPNGQTHWLQPIDILSGAPEDGSTARMLLNWTVAGGDGGDFEFEVDGVSLGRPDTSIIYDGFLSDGELGSCYIDDSPVSFQEFFDFVTARSETPGAIEFSQDEITSSYAYSDGSVLSGQQ